MEQVESTREPRETAHAAPLITVRYWAAARQAAGLAEEKHRGATVAAVLDAAQGVRADSARFAAVLSVCSFIVGEQPLGARDPASVEVRPGDVIEVLPPFAGG